MRRRPTRRSVLHGFGTLLTLPLFESLTAPAPRRTEEGEPRPKRLVFLYAPNGVHVPAWTPTELGPDYTLAPTLEPLAALREHVLVLSGLAHDNARPHGDGPGDHARACASFLTGAHPYKGDGTVIRAGISVDQLAAQTVGRATRHPSLVLGCEPGRASGQCDSGYPCAYSGSLSWSSPSTPLPKEVSPRRVFERLFTSRRAGETPEEERRRLASRRSVLDFATDEARSLEGLLGVADRERLDQYLTSVREVERRVIAFAAGETAAPDGSEPPPESPGDYREHVRLTYELIALALQADQTRIVTFLLANEGTNRSYPFLEVPEGHHTLSHHGGDEHKQAQIAKIDRFQVGLLAEFLERLRDTPDGEKSLLDHSLVVYGGCIGDGNRHNHDELPILLAGHGGGAVRSGRHVRFPSNTPATNLFLDLLAAVGAPTDSFGDSTGPLALG